MRPVTGQEGRMGRNSVVESGREERQGEKGGVKMEADVDIPLCTSLHRYRLL